MKIFLKKSFCFIVYYSGLEHLIRKIFPINQVTIIMFHAVGDNSTLSKLPNVYNYYISKDKFKEKIKFFKETYNVISFTQLANYLQKGKVPFNSVILTFDDGYSHNEAFEILKEQDVPVCIFLTTDFIGSKKILPLNEVYYCIMNTKLNSLVLSIPPSDENKFFDLSGQKNKIETIINLNNALKKMQEKEKNDLIGRIKDKTDVQYEDQDSTGFKMLTWDEVVIMKKTGLIEFGSHTKTHCILSKVSIDQAFDEIKESKMKIEDAIGDKIKVFAFPNGTPDDFTDEHIEMLKQCGYEFACSTSFGFNDLRNDRFRLKRIGYNLPNYVLACKIAFQSRIKRFE